MAILTIALSWYSGYFIRTSFCEVEGKDSGSSLQEKFSHTYILILGYSRFSIFYQQIKNEKNYDNIINSADEYEYI